MKNELGKPNFDVDTLLAELALIDADEEWKRDQNDRRMRTPPELVYEKCTVRDGNFIDTWKMKWSDAKLLKKLMPELSLYWTDRYTATDGRIVIADTYEAINCGDLVFVINEINASTHQSTPKYKYQHKPKRLRLSRELVESFYKVP